MTTGERIKLRRIEIGLSAEDIAQELGVSPATIYRYENGGIDKIPSNRLSSIAVVLRTTPSCLMGWSDIEAPVSPECECLSAREVTLAVSMENQLQQEILSRYKSIRAFTIAIDIPYSTVDSILKRGMKNAGASILLRIFDALDLDIRSIQDGHLRHLNKAEAILQNLEPSYISALQNAKEHNLSADDLQKAIDFFIQARDSIEQASYVKKSQERRFCKM